MATTAKPMRQHGRHGDAEPKDAHALSHRKSHGRHADDDGIVRREDDVDENDLAKRREHIHAGLADDGVHLLFRRRRCEHHGRRLV